MAGPCPCAKEEPGGRVEICGQPEPAALVEPKEGAANPGAAGGSRRQALQGLQGGVDHASGRVGYPGWCRRSLAPRLPESIQERLGPLEGMPRVMAAGEGQGRHLVFRPQVIGHAPGPALDRVRIHRGGADALGPEALPAVPMDEPPIFSQGRKVGEAAQRGTQDG